MSGHKCYNCGSTHLRRSRRRTFLEAAILPLFLIRPYRCSQCQTRQYGIGFHRFRRSTSRTLLAFLLLGGLFVLVALALLFIGSVIAQW